MEWLLQAMPGFMLIFCRIASFFVVTPVFSARHVPNHFKIGLAFFVTLMSLPAAGSRPVSLDSLYIASLFKEVLVGLLLGFVASMFFTVMQMAGAFIDMQMGLTMANIIDPLTGAASPIIGNLKYVLAMLLFLSYDGHHWLLRAIMESYEWVPLHNEMFARLYEGSLTEFLLRTFTDTFSIAFQMAAPIMVAMFLTDVGLGVLARTAPQFNIFVVGVPIKLLIGFTLLVLVIPGMLYVFGHLFTSMFAAMQKLIDIMAGAVAGSSR